ncbi:hypothetical protein QOZ80_2BG0198550 [Eleusine coracana subsp. coracana]|nr:hypothetical protein QOZ80_2BG0198550 [Eleusine coracana subsp. coracana]
MPHHDEDAHFVHAEAGFISVADGVPQDRSRTTGSSTALIVSLHSTTLRSANLDDSAFVVLRGVKVVHRSTPQQHEFNCTFQLRSKGGDRVVDAEVGGAPVAEGDVVVVGTDNVFGAEMVLSPQSMADSIAREGGAVAVQRREMEAIGKKQFYLLRR